MVKTTSFVWKEHGFGEVFCAPMMVIAGLIDTNGANYTLMLKHY